MGVKAFHQVKDVDVKSDFIRIYCYTQGISLWNI